MTTRWSGFPGSPGYSNFYVLEDGNAGNSAQTLSEALEDFWLTVNGYLPTDVTVLVLPTWDQINEVTGLIELQGSVTTPATGVSGNNAGSYAGNVGALVEWQTAEFVAGKRLKGRTYLVPMMGIFDTDGTMSTASVSAIADACTALIAADVVSVVWHRPINGAGGSHGVITGATVRDRAAVLRSRSI